MTHTKTPRPVSSPRSPARRRSRTVSRLRCAGGCAALLAIAVSSGACSFNPSHVPPTITPALVNADLGLAADVPADQTTRSVQFEDPGVIRLVHGGTCTAPQAALSRDVLGVIRTGVKVSDHIDVPPQYDQATVFLNGWYAAYEHGDHHVVGLAAAIFNIQQSGGVLSWDAGGVLSDHNGDDDFEWCYFYTVAMWRSGAGAHGSPILFSHINATVFDRGDVDALTFPFPDFGDATDAYREQRFSSAGQGGLPRALLPRGFGAAFSDDDHHLLQFGLKFGDLTVIEPQARTQPPPARRFGAVRFYGPTAGVVAADPPAPHSEWDFETILKDNSVRRYFAAEMVSMLTGSGVHFVQPSLALVPLDGLDFGEGCIYSPAKTRSQTVTVPNLDFDYAVPVLTGWNLNYECGDEHVQEVGTWIESFHYVKGANGKGTLTYTIKSRLGDDGNSTGFDAAQQVSILGLDKTPGVTVNLPPSRAVLVR